MPVPHRGAVCRGLWGLCGVLFPGDSEPAGNFLGISFVMDWQDEVVGRVPGFLINASSISVGELPGLMAEFGGAAFPAH